LIMTRHYIETHFEDIKNHASDIEDRMDDSGLSVEQLIAENERNLVLCKEFGCEYILIDENYEEAIYENL